MFLFAPMPFSLAAITCSDFSLRADIKFQFARFALAIPFFVVVVNIMTKLFENPLMVRRLVIAI